MEVIYPRESLTKHMRLPNSHHRPSGLNLEGVNNGHWKD